MGRITRQNQTLLSGSIADCAGVEIQQMADEFIRVLRFDSVLIQDIAGEVIKIEGDNYTGLASCVWRIPIHAAMGV